jgi:hypothetical protein
MTVADVMAELAHHPANALLLVEGHSQGYNDPSVRPARVERNDPPSEWWEDAYDNTHSDAGLSVVVIVGERSGRSGC